MDAKIAEQILPVPVMVNWNSKCVWSNYLGPVRHEDPAEGSIRRSTIARERKLLTEQMVITTCA